jgi:hypothetical protein
MDDVTRIHSTPLTKPANSTTSASKTLSYALQGVIKTLRVKDDEFFKATGARRCWIVQSAEEVISEIKSQPSSFQHLTPRTADFTSMYTKLPQDRILRNVETAIREAHEYQKSKTKLSHGELFMYTTTKSRGEWTTEHSDDSLSVDDMIAHLHFVVKNTYFMASDGTLRHQLFGIPMGTNAGPEIANLCLYADEAAYIDKLLASGHTREAQMHANTTRFIDDVLSWSILPPSSDEYGLEWKETTNSDGSCTFLGVKIQKWLNGMIRLSVFDKASEWNFHVIRYPSKYSNIPIHQPAGIFTGQVTRFWQICNNVHDFKHAVTQLALRLLLRGHHASTLMKGWNKYVQRHHRRSTSLTTKVTHWFKRMVKWALNHPLPDPSSVTSRPKASPTPPPPPQMHPTNAETEVPRNANPPTPPHSTARNMQPQQARRSKRPRETTQHTSTGATHKKARLINLCGLHALNACMQAYSMPLLTFHDLEGVCFTLDAEERTMLFPEDSQGDRDYRMHIRRNGLHRNNQGFTIQSIERALRDRDIHVAQLTDPSPSRIPLNAKTLLFHKPVPAPIGHFFTLVKQGTTWHLWDNQACTASFSCLTECAHHFEACRVFYTS